MKDIHVDCENERSCCGCCCLFNLLSCVVGRTRSKLCAFEDKYQKWKINLSLSKVDIDQFELVFFGKKKRSLSAIERSPTELQVPGIFRRRYHPKHPTWIEHVTIRKLLDHGDAGSRTPDFPHAKRTRYHCATSPDDRWATKYYI